MYNDLNQLLMEIMSFANDQKCGNNENAQNEQVRNVLIARGLDEVGPACSRYRYGVNAKEVKEHQAKMGQPAIYVSTYGKYNDGSLAGLWIGVDTFDSPEELTDFCRRLHADEKDPEFMVQDFDGIPEALYHEAGLPNSLLWEWLELSELDREIVSDFSEVCSGDFEYALRHALSLYCCDVNYWEDYINDQIDLDGLPSWAKCYFNFEAYRRDCSYDFLFGDRYVFFNC